MSLERELGGVALLLPGAAGDQGPAERAMNVMFDAAGVKQTVDAHEDGYRMLHQQGQALGDALIEAARMARKDDATGIGARTVDVLLPAQTRADFHSLAPHRTYEFHAAGEQRTMVYLLRLETSSLSAYNPRSRVHSAPLCAPLGPALCLFATLVNGGQKYLPAPDAYEKITYEAMNSGFAADSHERLLQTILAALNAARQKGELGMNIGHARRKITPQGDIYLIGYRNLPNRLEPATGVHDDVFANAILFQQDDREVFLFNADVLEFEESMAEEVKTMLAERYGIDRDCVLLSATHDHTSIVAYHRSWWTGKFNEDYYRWFLDTICQCFEECRANARPATCRMGKKVITGFYDNRIIPGELADNEVIVVSFFDTEGKPFAGFVNWAVHSACVGPDCTELTSELAGLTGKKLAQSLGYYPAMVVGAAGDCSDRNFRQGRGIPEVERVSTGLAEAISQIKLDREVVLDRIEPQTFYHTVAHDDFSLTLKCVVISLGGLHLFVFPSELGSDLGIRMKRECPVEGIVCGYTNGYFEYFLPAREYGLSFETERTQIPQGEPERLCDKFCQTTRLLGAADSRL